LLRRRDRHERCVREPGGVDRGRKRLPNFGDYSFLVVPFRSAPTIDRLLKIKYELIGRTEAKTFAGGILAKKQARVTGS